MEKREDGRHRTQAERVVKAHGGVFNRGDWNKASDLKEEGARELALALEALHYQVRPVAQEKDGQWSVSFR